MTDGDLPVVIPPGIYDARVLRYRKVTRFRRSQYHLRFRIEVLGPYNGIELDAYAALQHDGKAGPRSKLARWVMTLEPTMGTCRREFSLRRLKDLLLQVEVRTVEQDHRQKKLPPERRYSVADDIAGCVGRIEAKTGAGLDKEQMG